MTKRKQRYPQPEPTSTTYMRHKIQPKGFAQEQYLESLRNTPITISNGPAGSGKTFLVVGVALEKLLTNQVSKIILTRPVVESDEELGFLPGTIEEKLDPYLRPLYDAIEEHVGITKAKAILESGKVEIAPLAYMRGRTFTNAFVILDEAQNATVKQIKLFLTRIGMYSQYAINGDVTQCDLKRPKDVPASEWENGLEYAWRKLAGGRSSNINCLQFSYSDIVRSELCKEVVELMDAPDDKGGLSYNDISTLGSPARTESRARARLVSGG